jgi:hypothetical protein
VAKSLFSGALDGIQARLIRRTKFGYTVELLESKGEFRKGDRVYLSVTEFEIKKRNIDHDATAI